MAYLYFIKIRILVSLEYRFEAISAVLIQFILLIINAFFWRALYSTYDTVQDTTLEQMLTYSIISVLLSCFFRISIESKLRDRIRQGSVAVDYIKPVNLFGMLLAEDIGDIVVNIIQKAIPIVIFSFFFIQAPLPASFLSLLTFLVSAIFSFLIMWMISAIFGLLNFWLIDIGPIGGAIQYIISFVSGSIVPIWFFPEIIQKILSFTPFIYIYQTPIAIYIGRIPLEQAGIQIIIQIVWTGVFFLLFRFVKSRVMGNIVVQGG